MKTIDRLQSLYRQLDSQVSAGEDVVADLRKEINNLELAYLKEEVLPMVATSLGAKIKNLRCGLDCSIQFDDEGVINYSFCTSGSLLMVKDSLNAKDCVVENYTPIVRTANNASNALVDKSNTIGTNFIRIVDYSENSIVVYGDTHQLASSFGSIGGYFNANLNEGPGWVFSKKRRPKVEKLLAPYIDNQDFRKTSVGLSDNLFSCAGVEIQNSMTEDDWINYITSMKCMPYNGYTAPHKAIFLLTIIESIRCNFLKDNIVYPTKRIEETFRMIWNKYVPKDWPFTMNFYQPYVHLSGEFFYEIVKVNDRAKFDINTNWNATQASRYIRHGVLDERLFELLKDKQFANRATDELLYKYLDCHTTFTNQYKKSIEKSEVILPTRKSPSLQILSITAGHINITEGNPTSKFVQFLNEIGPEQVSYMHINYLNGNLVSKTPNPKYINASKKLNGGYWVNTNSCTKTKIEQIKLICSNLGINVNIEMGNESVIGQISEPISSKRRTLFSLNGNTPLNKRMSVLACVRLFMHFNPNIPFEVVERNFPPELQGSYGVVAKLSKVNSRILQGYDDNNRYFLDKDKILKAKDGVEFVVCHEWGNQFHKFQQHINKRFGWTLEEV